MNAPAPAFNYEAFAAREDAKHAAFADGQRGQSIETYRATLQAILKRKALYDELGERIKQIESDIDQATNEHAATCGPLQEQLERDDIDTDTRIQLRQQVIQANEKLEATVAPARKQIAAAEAERQLLATRGVSPQVVEYAVADSFSDEERLHVNALRKAIELAKAMAFNTRKASEAADASLTTEQENRKRNRGSYDVGELQQRARLANKVHAYIANFENSLQQELNDLRAAKIARLYE